MIVPKPRPGALALYTGYAVMCAVVRESKKAYSARTMLSKTKTVCFVDVLMFVLIWALHLVRVLIETCTQSSYLK